MRDILAEGWWCAGCEVFEPEEDFGPDRCISCGCSPSEHVEVEVVTR